MKKQILLAATIALCLSSTAWAYDTNMAASYAKLFAPVEGANAGDALHFIKVDAFIKDFQDGKEMVAIDVRTPGETAMFNLALPGSLRIPVNELFKPENLKKIPTDKPVIIVCKSGARATAVGTALRHAGFDNVYILKGGSQDLLSSYGPKQAYPAPAKK